MTDHKSRLVYFSSFQFNKIIQTLTYSDSFLWGGYYMMNALVAIYLQQKIAIDPLQVISFGFAVYMISRSIFQIPIAHFLDSHKSYIDEAYAIFLSCMIMGSAVFGYVFISEAWHLYLLQFIFGLGAAINMPAWRKTFARFVDKGHEGVEYSIYDIINNLVIALLTTFGGFLVSSSGKFEYLFSFSGILIFIGGFIALFLLKNKKISIKE